MNQSVFTAARIRLTLQYTLTIALLGFLLSTLFYFRASSVLQIEYNRINMRLQQEEVGVGRLMPPPGMRRRITVEDLQVAKNQFIRQLVLINTFVLLMTCLSSWFLSGVTLNPIARAMDEQKRFVGDAAHELKTPITAMKTALEVQLLDKKIPARVRQIIKENVGDVERLEKLAARLLAMTTYEEQTLKTKRVALEPMLTKALRIVKPLADLKQIRLLVEPTRLSVIAHEESIVELLVILLDNAVKYSERDATVTVCVGTRGKKAVVSVEDNGVGIAAKHLPNIFNRFYRADASRSQVHGHGLGLALAKTIVQRQKGTITATSTLGKGSVFEITLPLA